ncbi:Transferase [Trema orientale]|uniref:Transferase n=1 Tax=Trema orientale TaxID=63057 RepID=A0A2P5F1E0_TREOI|nr:Transferase [Trema orientale]
MLSPSAAVEIPTAGARLSTVVPGKSRGENEDLELTNVDLAVKLHYIKGVYFFRRITATTTAGGGGDRSPIPVAGGISIDELKRPMFALLDRFFPAAGRIRRSDDGRPYIKCNDAGVRIVEAFCDELTVDECLATRELGASFHDRLCYKQVLGPDLGFSPLVFLQFTWFKCGGLSVGLSWAHILGDVVSASTFINVWAQIMAGHVPQKSLHVPSSIKLHDDDPQDFVANKPFSLKELDPVENYWSLPANNGQNMRTRSFRVSSKQLDLLMSNTCGKKAANFSRFEILSAIIWKSLSRIRENSGPKMVTICCYKYPCGDRDGKIEILNNKDIVVSTIKTSFEADVSELAYLIANKRTIENDAIEEIVGRNNGKGDFSMYGTNLTFVNLEEVEIYGLEVKGERPIFANYTIEGVGDEGLVLVLPGSPKMEEEDARTVTVLLPEYQLAHLENELKTKWDIA